MMTLFLLALVGQMAFPATSQPTAIDVCPHPFLNADKSDVQSVGLTMKLCVEAKWVELARGVSSPRTSPSPGHILATTDLWESASAAATCNTLREPALERRIRAESSGRFFMLGLDDSEACKAGRMGSLLVGTRIEILADPHKDCAPIMRVKVSTGKLKDQIGCVGVLDASGDSKEPRE